MTIEEIAAQLDATHASMMMLARTIAQGAEGEVGYRFKSQGGEEIPTLDKLAAELRKHA